MLIRCINDNIVYNYVLRGNDVPVDYTMLHYLHNVHFIINLFKISQMHTHLYIVFRNNSLFKSA